MAEEPEQHELDDLRALLEKNALAIQTLRHMIDNMEVLLTRLEGEKQTGEESTRNPSPDGEQKSPTTTRAPNPNGNSGQTD
jgi:hypothetical protein